MSILEAQKSIISGSITPPGSKSIAHRAMICSFLAGGGEVNGITPSKDITATASAIEALKCKKDTIDCCESGSTLRFMLPVAAALGKSVTFTGRGRLPERPIGEYLRLFGEHGVKCRSKGGLPLTVEGRLTSGEYSLAGDVSSQYVTGLLLALPLLEGDSKIVLTSPLQSKPYVDITVSVMKEYGIEVKEEDNAYFVRGLQEYKKTNYTVESDWSQAAFFLASGAIGGNVSVKGLNPNSAQGDKQIINVLKRFGAELEIKDDTVNIRKSALKGINVNVSDIPDAVPAIAVCAAFAKGKTVITGGERLRFKESDRLESVASNLTKMGINATQTADGLIIGGGEPKAAELCGYNDHRIVMAFSVAAVNCEGVTRITDAESIEKSYPEFFGDLKSLGGRINVIRDR
ncbi:MAG: 3-phosphoshikimate 1-carboxyvinyltransferase [Eubacterium sp.]|nr:3-phosphoshikimate 1-carboxyvinyltransferase [Eubacterium sp.]